MNPQAQGQRSPRPTRMGRLSWVRVAVPLMFVLTGAFLLRLQVMATANEAQAPSAHSGFDQRDGQPVQTEAIGSFAAARQATPVAEPSIAESEVYTSRLLGP